MIRSCSIHHVNAGVLFISLQGLRKVGTLLTLGSGQFNRA